MSTQVIECGRETSVEGAAYNCVSDPDNAGADIQRRAILTYLPTLHTYLHLDWPHLAECVIVYPTKP